MEDLSPLAAFFMLPIRVAKEKELGRESVKLENRLDRTLPPLLAVPLESETQQRHSEKIARLCVSQPFKELLPPPLLQSMK